MTYDEFIDRREQERLDRMHVESLRRRRNAMSKFRAWYRLRWVEDI